MFHKLRLFTCLSFLVSSLLMTFLSISFLIKGNQARCAQLHLLSSVKCFLMFTPLLGKASLGFIGSISFEIDITFAVSQDYQT